MNKPFFCSIAAQRASEDLVGTAGHYQTYVLIECPLPWPSTAFDSEHISPELRQYIKALSASKTVRFLCISRDTQAQKGTTLIVYDRLDRIAPSVTANNLTQFSSGYRGCEFHLDNLNDVISCLEAYWQNKALPKANQQLLGQPIAQQDILVCTHGMKDKCCAKLGKPIFRGAERMAEKGTLQAVRIWRASHIGGHRFAPTAIVLPDGRYYGRLSLSALQALVTHQGAIEQLRPVYRGWSLLPKPLQLLEKELLLTHGWSWFTRGVSYQQVCSDTEEGAIAVELSALEPNGKITYYRADICQDEQQTYLGKKSCNDSSPSQILKYKIVNFSIEQNSLIKPSLEPATTNKTAAPL